MKKLLIFVGSATLLLGATCLSSRAQVVVQTPGMEQRGDRDYDRDHPRRYDDDYYRYHHRRYGDYDHPRTHRRCYEVQGAWVCR